MTLTLSEGAVIWLSAWKSWRGRAYRSRYAGKVALLDNVGWVDTHERQMLASASLALDLAIPTEQSGRPVAHRQSQ